jgi:hypothetical protein
MILKPWTGQNKPPLGVRPIPGHPLMQEGYGWLLNERTGDRVYDVISRQPGVLMNMDLSTAWVPGGLNFDGVNDYVNCGTINLSGPQITLAARVYVRAFRTVTPYISSICGEESGVASEVLIRFGESLANNGKLQFAFGREGGTEAKLSGTVSLSTDRWYHIVGTYDGSTMCIYVDGALYAKQASWGIITANTAFTIGNNSTGSRPLDGAIGDCYVSRRALSAAQVGTLAAQPYSWLGTPDWPLMYTAAGGETQTVYPDFAQLAAAAYAPTPVPGSINALPGLAQSTATAYAATAQPGSINALPGLAQSVATAYAATGQPGSVTALPGLAEVLATAYAAAGVPGAVTALAEFAESSAEAFGAEAIVGAVTVSPAFAASVAAAYAPTAQPGAVTVLPGFVQRTAGAWDVTAYIAGAGSPYYYLMLVANRQGRN